MELVNEKIIIKYQTAKEYCSCCSREFEIPEYGEFREFEITLGDLFKWNEWENEKLKIVDGETNRVASMILKTIEKE